MARDTVAAKTAVRLCIHDALTSYPFFATHTHTVINSPKRSITVSPVPAMLQVMCTVLMADYCSWQIPVVHEEDSAGAARLMTIVFAFLLPSPNTLPSSRKSSWDSSRGHTHPTADSPHATCVAGE